MQFMYMIVINIAFGNEGRKERLFELNQVERVAAAGGETCQK